MQVYLVEYKMMWAGKVVKEGVEETSALSDLQAQKQVEQYLRTINRKAEIHFGNMVTV